MDQTTLNYALIKIITLNATHVCHTKESVGFLPINRSSLFLALIPGAMLLFSTIAMGIYSRHIVHTTNGETPLRPFLFGLLGFLTFSAITTLLLIMLMLPALHCNILNPLHSQRTFKVTMIAVGWLLFCCLDNGVRVARFVSKLRQDKEVIWERVVPAVYIVPIYTLCWLTGGMFKPPTEPEPDLEQGKQQGQDQDESQEQDSPRSSMDEPRGHIGQGVQMRQMGHWVQMEQMPQGAYGVPGGQMGAPPPGSQRLQPPAALGPPPEYH